MRALFLTLPLALVACNPGPASEGPVGTAGTSDTAAPAKDETMDENIPASDSTPEIQRAPDDFGRIVEPPHEPDSDRVNPSGGGTVSNDDLSAPKLTPEAAKGEKGARNVLLEWGAALEHKDFARAYAQFGDDGARSGMSEKAYAESFAKYRTITVAMPTGSMEGSAGSLYYTAPTTITGELNGGGSYRLRGPVVLRRVNDVPGASAEQLRWHIYSADLEPQHG